MINLIFSLWGYLAVILSCIICCNYCRKRRRNIRDQVIPTTRDRNIQRITVTQLNELVGENSTLTLTNLDRIIEQNSIENNSVDIQIYTQTGKYNSDIKNECTICLEIIVKNDKIRILPCFHIYHKDCVDPWLIKKTTCPICCKNISPELNLL